MKVPATDDFTLSDIELRFSRLTSNAVYIFDLTTLSNSYVNDSAAEILGLSIDTVLGLKNQVIQHIVHRDDLPEVLQHFNRFSEVADHDIVEIKYRVLNAEGKWRWQLAKESIFKRNSEGKATHIIGVAQDITELEEARSEAVSLEEDLLSKSHKLLPAVDDIYGLNPSAAHDILGNVRKMVAFSLLIKEPEQLSNHGIEWLGKIARAAQNTEQMLERMLSFAEASAPYQPSIVDLNAIVRQLQRQHEKDLHSKEALVYLEPLPRVEGNERLLTVLFSELLNNAIKFSRNDVPLLIRISLEKLFLENGISFASIKFEDNGIGLSHEFKEQIFLPFERLHSLKEYPGCGLGLSICRRIAEHHNGKIYALQNDGNGLAVMLSLPVLSNL